MLRCLGPLPASRPPWRIDPVLLAGSLILLLGASDALHPTVLPGQNLPGEPVSLQFVDGILDRTVDPEILPEGDPWTRLRTAVSDEDQPMTTYAVGLQGGVWLLPWLSTEVDAGWVDLDGGASSEEATYARAVVGLRWERFDLEGAVWGGGFRRFRIERGDWAGGGVVRYEGPAGLSLEVRSDRDMYLGTRASLADSLTVTLIRGRLARRSDGGWSGRVSFTELLLSDGNRIDDAGAWFLAPILRSEDGGFRAGYALRAADSDESSYAALDPWRWDYQGRLAGWYAGAYTPAEILSHSLLLQAWYGRSGGVRVVLDGSWGFHAREDRPVLVAAVPGAPDSSIDLQFQREHYVPWDITGEIEMSIRPGWDFRFGGGYRRSAFQGGGYAEIGTSLSSPR
ncbi:MAG: hypothetical protein ACLFWG_07550 [Longimicrobiales bacterium]